MFKSRAIEISSKQVCIQEVNSAQVGEAHVDTALLPVIQQIFVSDLNLHCRNRTTPHTNDNRHKTPKKNAQIARGVQDMRIAVM